MEDENTLEDLKRILEELKGQLLEACTHLDIWEQLFPTKTVVDVINQYKGFFLPTIDAHADRFMIKVSNIISYRSDQPSFYNIFKKIKINPSLLPELEINKLRKRLRQNKKALEEIREYRNNRVAHWNIDLKTEFKPPIFLESKRMLEDLQGIFNEIYAKTHNAKFSFQYSQHGNTTGLLNALITKRNQDLEMFKNLESRGM